MPPATPVPTSVDAGLVEAILAAPNWGQKATNMATVAKPESKSRFYTNSEDLVVVEKLVWWNERDATKYVLRSDGSGYAVEMQLHEDLSSWNANAEEIRDVTPDDGVTFEQLLIEAVRARAEADHEAAKAAVPFDLLGSQIEAQASRVIRQVAHMLADIHLPAPKEVLPDDQRAAIIKGFERRVQEGYNISRPHYLDDDDAAIAHNEKREKRIQHWIEGR